MFDRYYLRHDEKYCIDRFIGLYEKLRRKCKRFGITVLPAMELVLDKVVFDDPKLFADILVFGITPEQIREYGFSLMEHDQKEFYELARKNGWIIGQAHPYRKCCDRLDPKYLDFVEIYNGHPGHDSHTDLATEFATENNLIGTAGSDFHFCAAVGSGILTEAPIKTLTDLVEVIKSGNFELLKRDPNG